MIVIRKNLSEELGERVLIDRILYFFYITNDRDSTADEVVFSCNESGAGSRSPVYTGICHDDTLIRNRVKMHTFLLLHFHAIKLAARCDIQSFRIIPDSEAAI